MIANESDKVVLQIKALTEQIEGYEFQLKQLTVVRRSLGATMREMRRERNRLLKSIGRVDFLPLFDVPGGQPPGTVGHPLGCRALSETQDGATVPGDENHERV